MSQRHPQLAAGLPALAGILNLDAQIVVGQPINVQNVQEAERTARLLEELGAQPNIVETARNRATAIRNIHSGIEFHNLNPPAINLLQQIQLDVAAMNANMAAMNANIATTNAATGNFRIISRNSRILVPNPLAPLQKSTPGDGRNLAQPLLTAGVHLPPAAAAANVGAFPPAFNGDPTSYTHQEIINLIVFYNDAFGIVVGDVLTTRRNKLREWMSVL